MELTDRVIALAAELREAGVPVSVADTRDAVRALTLVPLENRAAVRAALGVTLVKQQDGRRVFDRLFDVFFPLTTAPSQRGDGNGRGELPEELQVRDRLRRALTEMDEDELRAIAEELVEEEAEVDPNARVSDEHYRYRALRGLDLEDLLRRLVEENVAGKGLTALQRRLFEEDFQERMEQFAEEVSEEIRRRRRQGLDLGEQIRQQRSERPDEVDFLWAKDSDIEAMRAAIYPLGRRLALRLSNKRRASRRGRLDVRKTIRRSLSTGGVMLEPRFRRPSTGKPELWVVCDISGSMRSFARFTLELVYALATQFQRVRSFVFIDALDEVTGMIDVSGDFARTLDRIDSEADVVQFDGQSWYGNSLKMLWGRYGRELSPRTTVLVLGDARNNYRTTGAEMLREVAHNCRRLWWLNPEPRQYWDSADSVAGQFARQIDSMYECRNLQQLESFVARAL